MNPMKNTDASQLYDILIRTPLSFGRMMRKLTLVGLAILGSLLILPAANAQSVIVRPTPLRITVPVGVVSSNGATLNITTAGITTGVNLAVTGVPANAGASLSQTAITSNATVSVTLILTNNASLAQGTYDVAIAATGDASYRLPLPLIAAYVWSGASFTNGVSTNFGTAGNWTGGVVPGPTDDVVFRDSGGVGTSVTPTNVIVTTNREVASIRFASEANGNRFYNVEINSGATLKVTGTNGFSLLRDIKGSNNRLETFFSGGGTLMVSNPAANFALLNDNQANTTLDMQELANLYIDVNRIPLGDYRAYPNISTNGYEGGGGTGGNSEPSRFLPLVWLAKTNVIKAAYVDPNNYNDNGIRNYALTIGNYHLQGTTQNPRFQLGYSNAFFLDSICFGQALQGGGSANYNFLNSGSYALFRGTGGMSSRMSVFASADAAGPDPSSANTRGRDVNFSNGTVDALVDRLWLGIDKTNNSSQMTIQATLTLAAGTFDVNNAFLGYQRSGDNPFGTNGFAGPEGVVNVNGTTVFKVNNTLNLGYTTATAPGGGATAERCSGTFNISGGTAMVSNIVAGGATGISSNNVITMSSGATLIVSNAIGSTNKWLTSLNMNGNSTIRLHINADRTDPYIFATNFNLTGVGNSIFLVNFQNASFPLTVPFVAYTSGNPGGLQVSAPEGFTPAIVANGPNQYDLVVTTNLPKNLVWRGTTADWDFSTKNWLDTGTGLMTNFVNGDVAVFDGTLGFPTNINIVGSPLLPSGIRMTNSTEAYTFSGSGSIQGSATFNKWGSGNVTINGSTTIPVSVNEGRLSGGGTIGSAAVAAGARMNFTGTISGGISCGGTATTSGNVTGIISLLGPSGIYTNNGTTDGTIVFGTNTLVVNGGTMNNLGSTTVSTNATLINAGTITATSIAVATNGTLKDMGAPAVLNIALTVTIGSGGTFIPGGDGIGTTTIHGIGGDVNFGRAILQTGSTNIFKVNLTNAQTSTKLLTAHMSFGPNQSSKSFNGGMVLVTNIGPVALAAGQSFQMFGNEFNGGNVLDAGLNTTNSYSVMLPPVPGPGLAWDLNNLIPGGIIAIHDVATNPAPLASTFFYTDIINTNGAGSTNPGIVFEFSWPTNYLGWRLQNQENPLTIGISNNWSDLFSRLTNTYVTTNVLQTNRATFYRLTFP